MARSLAITSDGVADIRWISRAIVSPVRGVMRMFSRSQSARNWGSSMVFIKASRRALMRPAGTPGGATIGRPIAGISETKSSRARSAGFEDSVESSGVSGNSWSGVGPAWMKKISFFLS